MGTPERSAAAQQVLAFVQGKEDTPYLPPDAFNTMDWAESLLTLVQDLKSDLRNQLGFVPLARITSNTETVVMSGMPHGTDYGKTMQVYVIFNGSDYFNMDIASMSTWRILLDRNGNLWHCRVGDGGSYTDHVQLIGDRFYLERLLESINSAFKGHKHRRAGQIILENILGMADATVEAKAKLFYDAQRTRETAQQMFDRIHNVTEGEM